MPHSHPARLERDRTFGQRMADHMANSIGSWRFLIIQSIILAFWIVFNTVALVRHWDGPPFILLNLMLSFQAAYTGPVLLVSANRQSEVDRAHAENAYLHVNEVNAKQDQQLDLLSRQLDILESQNATIAAQHLEMLARLPISGAAS